MKAVLLKLIVLVAVIAGALVGAGLLVAHYRSETLTNLSLTDPALEFLAAPEPPELKGLVRRINQFTRLEDAIEIAKRAGYVCTTSSEEQERLRRYTGPRDTYCPAGSDELKPQSKVLILRSSHPRGFMRGLELRSIGLLPPAPFDRAKVIAAAPSVATGKGIEFAAASVFGDLVADRFNGYYEQNCLGEFNPTTRGQCADFGAQRAAQGPPKRDGKPLRAGNYEHAVGVLAQLGLECGQPSFLERVSLRDSDTATVVCETRAFSGQLQTVSLETDARTAIPQALIVELAQQRERIELASRPAAPGAVAVMVKTLIGEARIATLSPVLSDGSSNFALQNYASFDAPSQRRLAGAAVGQIQTLLAAPSEPLAAPALQRLDIAAYLLARLGADAVALASADLPDLPIATIAAVALAACRVNAEAGDCLVKFALAHPALRDTLAAALDEAQQATPALPDNSPVRARFARLAAQINATRK